MDTKTVFDDLDLYRSWDDDYYPPVAQRYYDRAIRQMLACLKAGPGDVILDAGCGPGVHSIRVARQGCKVRAIDISLAALEEGRRRAEFAGVADQIHFEHGDLTSLDYDNESFDKIFSWGVVIHIPEVERALAELVRILKPGGRLALYVTNAKAWDHSIMALARCVLRRPSPVSENHALGRGCWYDMNGDRLWVWTFDIQALVRHLESLGLRRTHRMAGSLTEIQRRLRGPARQILLTMHNAWYALRFPAGPCVTNLLVFEKIYKY